MPITYSGKSVLDPKPLLERAQKDPALATLVDLWRHKANSFRTTIGPDAGRGYLLMLRRDVDAVNKAGGFHNLQFQSTWQGGKDAPVVIKNLVFVGAKCVSPGADTDPLAAYLVELADLRWLAWNPHFANPVNKAYNVRVPAGAQTYYQDSLNSGSPYGWQDVLNDLWSQVNVSDLGSSPTIPSSATTPAKNPEGLRFHGVPAWLAYNEVLRRLGLAFVLNPFTAAASIVQMGATSTALTNAEARYKPRRIEDLNVIEGTQAKVPKQVQVFFHKFSLDYGAEPSTGWGANLQWSVPPLTSVTVSDPNSTHGTYANSTAIIFDDLPALIQLDGVTISNSSDLNNRATERANDFYRQLNTGGKWKWRQYSGFIGDTAFVPGSQITALAFRDFADGWKTEILHAPMSVRNQVIPGNAAMLTGPGGFAATTGGMGGSAPVAEILQRPDMGRQSYPIYPPQVQVLMDVGTGPVVGQTYVYDGRVLRVDPALGGNTQLEKCWIYSATSVALSQNQLVTGKLDGTAIYNPGGGNETRPFYVTTPTAGGGGAPNDGWAGSGSNVSVAANTWTQLTLGTIRTGWGSGNSITIPSGIANPGYFVCRANAQWIAPINSGADFTIIVAKNSTTGGPFDRGGPCSTNGIRNFDQQIFSLIPTDTVSVWALHNDSSNRSAAVISLVVEFLST